MTPICPMVDLLARSNLSLYLSYYPPFPSFFLICYYLSFTPCCKQVVAWTDSRVTVGVWSDIGECMMREGEDKMGFSGITGGYHLTWMKFQEKEMTLFGEWRTPSFWRPASCWLWLCVCACVWQRVMESAHHTAGDRSLCKCQFTI